MAIDPSIIFRSQTVNPVQSFSQGAQAGKYLRELRRENKRQTFEEENAQGLMSGDPNVMNAYAELGIQPAMQLQGQHLQADSTRLGMDATRLNMDAKRQQMEFQRQANARANAAAARAARSAAEAAKAREAVVEGRRDTVALATAIQQGQGEQWLAENGQQGVDPTTALNMLLVEIGEHETALGRALGPDPMEQIDMQTAQTELGLKELELEQAQKQADAPPPPNFKDESSMRKEFTGIPAVKEFSAMSEAMGRVDASAKRESAAGDLALIFNFMKVQDPTSVVRESEFATAEKAAAWLEESEATGTPIPRSVASAIRKMQTGERLSDVQRADFVETVRDIYSAAETQYNARRERYVDRAKQYGFDPDRAVPDFRYVQPERPEPVAVEPEVTAAPPPTVSGADMDAGTLSRMSARELIEVDPLSLPEPLKVLYVKLLDEL